MNLSVMYGILDYLLKVEKASAEELASKFEITPRSVYRYVDHMIVCGVPIFSKIGRNGGIYLDKSYKLDATFLSQDEKKLLISALSSIDSPNAKSLLIKLNLI